MIREERDEVTDLGVAAFRLIRLAQLRGVPAQGAASVVLGVAIGALNDAAGAALTAAELRRMADVVEAREAGAGSARH